MKQHIIPFFTFHCFLLLFLLSACETEIEYRGDEQDPLLVVNCIAEAGDVAYITVSHSVFFLDNTPDADVSLADASVTLEVNGDAATPAYDADWGMYIDNRQLHEGDRLKVTVMHPTYGTVTAEDTVPHSLAVTSDEKLVPYQQPDPNSDDTDTPDLLASYCRTDSVWKVTLHIDSPAEGIHCYRMTFDACSWYRVRPDWIPNWALNISTEDCIDDGEQLWGCDGAYYEVPATTQMALGLSESGLSFMDIDVSLGSVYFCGAQTFLFTDEYLQGDTGADLTFNVLMHTPVWWGGSAYWYDLGMTYTDAGWEYDGEQNWGNPWDALDTQFTFCVKGTLETLSPAYYNYLQSCEKYQESDWTLFSEPVQVYSNINGGLGVLGTACATSFGLSRDYTFTF